MKHLKKLAYLFFTLAIMVSCEKESSETEVLTIEENVKELSFEEKFELFKNEINFDTEVYNKSEEKALIVETEIEYTDLCGETLTATHIGLSTIGTPERWDYYRFYGQQNDVVSIWINRQADWDPTFRLIEGVFDNYLDAYNAVVLDNADDEIEHPGCFGDPRTSDFVLPSTGWFTVGVRAWWCDGGQPFEYEISTSGIYCDSDNDGFFDNEDNCPTTPNADQADLDEDGIGDVCDDCPNDADNDIDGDGICGDIDNCPDTANADQADMDEDGIGDVCDEDIDGDDILNEDDNCPTTPNPNQEDYENDGMGDACDDDWDNDGCLNNEDVHPFSDLSETVIIDGCDTEVENGSTDSCGVNMMDEIDDLIAEISAKAQEPRNRYQRAYKAQAAFKMGMYFILAKWQSKRYITRSENSAIMKCVGRSTINFKGDEPR